MAWNESYRMAIQTTRLKATWIFLCGCLESVGHETQTALLFEQNLGCNIIYKTTELTLNIYLHNMKKIVQEKLP